MMLLKQSMFAIITNMKNPFFWLSPDHQIFMYAAQLGSISAVSRKIGRDPGNLSRAITRLEDLHGTPLFIRHQGGMKLTLKGNELYLSLLRASDAFTDSSRPAGVRVIRIGFSSSVGFGFMGPFFALLARLNLHPEFTLRPSLQLYELLKAREIDFILSPRSPKFPGVISSAFFTTRLTLCSRHGRPARTIIHSDMVFELAERLKNISFEQTVIIDDDLVSAKLLEHSDDHMGIIPECILPNFPKLKIIDHFKEEKIFAITWKGSVGVELLREGKKALL
jgi:hypothetical protein